MPPVQVLSGASGGSSRSAPPKAAQCLPSGVSASAVEGESPRDALEGRSLRQSLTRRESGEDWERACGGRVSAVRRGSAGLREVVRPSVP